MAGWAFLMQLDPKEQSYWQGISCLAIILVLLIAGIWLMGGNLLNIP